MATKVMTFEPTITLGGIIGPMITGLTLLAGYVAHRWKKSKDAEIAALLAAQKFQAIDAKLDTLGTAVAGISEVLRVQAVMVERIDNLEDTVKELKHGHGFVLPFEPHKRTF